ncbi:MAG: hypothetical protein FJ146_10415 [Deltaproteobacteria bacterium]|nr:hypothetical protein [Deltaproteobacteria bacterium]
MRRYLQLILKVVFGTVVLTASAAFADDQTATAVVIPRTGEFELNVFPVLEELRETEGSKPTVQSVINSQFAAQFQPVQVDGVFMNDGDKWFRFRVQNERDQAVPAVCKMSAFKRCPRC